MKDHVEKAILVGVKQKSNYDNFDSSLDELKGLMEAAGGQVLLSVKQSRERPEASTYLGKGKLKELVHLVEELEPDLVVFNTELSPVQLRNLDEVLNVKVIDRTMLILDIFSQRARSKEGQLQVELAQLEYQLPRLTGKGRELSRLGGGIGTRGAGEQKLELDRRYIRKRIHDIKEQLQTVRKTRELHRARRKRQDFTVVSLVGYTNAGKSSLFNALCEIAHSSGHKQVEADNRLFQTLDTTTRKIRTPSGRELLITDTVGFIQDLPHHLVAAFRSTLEEAIEADIIVHVVDAADPEYMDKMQVVREVLEELGSPSEKIMTVFNKVDLIPFLESSNGLAAMVSARTGQGLTDLMAQIERRLD
ncbi:MAG: GTPase HflX [Syntrophomonadaceae bacterium]|jgi:GTP-binding protein HflX